MIIAKQCQNSILDDVQHQTILSSFCVKPVYNIHMKGLICVCQIHINRPIRFFSRCFTLLCCGHVLYLIVPEHISKKTSMIIAKQ